MTGLFTCGNLTVNGKLNDWHPDSRKAKTAAGNESLVAVLFLFPKSEFIDEGADQLKVIFFTTSRRL